MNDTAIRMTQFFVDWISATLAFDVFDLPFGFSPLTDEIRHFGNIFTGSMNWVQCKPRWGYQLAWRDQESGAVIQMHPTRPDMGVNFVFTGQVLAKLDWESVLHKLTLMGAKFSRIDLTVDFDDPEFDPGQVYDKFMAGAAKTRAQRATFLTSESGETLYVGGRSSEKFLRIYDKGGEQGEELGWHWRVELECKGGAATFVAEFLQSENEKFATAIIIGFFDVPDYQPWRRALSDATPAVHVPSAKKRPDTEAWLMTTVLDIMAQAELRNPGFLDNFYDEVVKKL